MRRYKPAKRSKPTKREQETAVITIEIIVGIIIGEGGAVLRESFGFTQEQATAWAGEALARADKRVNGGGQDGG